MNGIMSVQEFELKGKEYEDAINCGDYQEALKLNKLIYESQFMKYRVLQQARRQWEQRKSELEAKFGQLYYRELENYNERIEFVKRGLEILLKIAIKLQEIK